MPPARMTEDDLFQRLLQRINAAVPLAPHTFNLALYPPEDWPVVAASDVKGLDRHERRLPHSFPSCCLLWTGATNPPRTTPEVRDVIKRDRYLNPYPTRQRTKLYAQMVSLAKLSGDSRFALVHNYLFAKTFPDFWGDDTSLLKVKECGNTLCVNPAHWEPRIRLSSDDRPKKFIRGKRPERAKGPRDFELLGIDETDFRDLIDNLIDTALGSSLPTFHDLTHSIYREYTKAQIRLAISKNEKLRKAWPDAETEAV